jgi:deazaflavin-dependent oxidoreductase (nitroreductase family)
VFYVEDGDSIVVAATNFGLREHPEWSENLLRNASAEVQIGDVTRRFRARAATSDEVARAWPRLVAFWPAFNTGTKERSGRERELARRHPGRLGGRAPHARGGQPATLDVEGTRLGNGNPAVRREAQDAARRSSGWRRVGEGVSDGGRPARWSLRENRKTDT